MREPRVYIEQPIGMDIVRLHVVQDRSDVGVEWLTEQGFWITAPEGSAPPVNAGIPLPPGVIRPLLEELTRQYGDQIPSRAEGKVLREVLAKEQARVDRVLEGR